MCGIVGIVRKDGQDAVPSVREMMESIKHRGPDGAGVVAAGRVSRASAIDELDWDNARGNSAMGHTRLAVVGGSHGQQPFLSNDGRLILLHNGEIYNYKALRASLKGRHEFETQTDSEVLVHLLAQRYDGDLFETMNNVVPHLDGDYAIAVTDGESIVIARDLIGVKQLYWSEDETRFAFASEKKALWRIGLTEAIRRLQPGEVMRFCAQGMERRRRTPDFLRSQVPTISNFEEALSTYRATLRSAVSKRVEDLDKLGIIFSGGVDSALVTAIAQELGAEVTCYVAGVADSPDIEYARMAAAQMGFPLQVNSLDPGQVLQYIPKIISCIEDRSLGQIEVAIPIFAAVEMAHEDQQIVLLTGQGADELFGGYPWYRRIIELDGYDEFEFRMWDDLIHLYNETLEREDKITMDSSIELRVPYLDPQVIRVAFSMEPQYKIRSAKDTSGKYIHRVLASTSGVPDEIAWRSKEAAQHGAGIHYKLVALAEAEGFDNALAEKVSYNGHDSVGEVLGSSQRYGFRYDKAGKWATQDHVQLWLDSMAYDEGLLSPAEQKELEPVIQKAAALRSA